MSHHADPPRHGAPSYLQLPASDVGASAGFYQAVFGWSTDLEWAAFEAPQLTGQWVTDRQPSPSGGPPAPADGRLPGRGPGVRRGARRTGARPASPGPG